MNCPCKLFICENFSGSVYKLCVFMNKFHVTYGVHCAVSICIKLTSSLTKELAVYYGQFSRREDLVI